MHSFRNILRDYKQIRKAHVEEPIISRHESKHHDEEDEQQ